MHAVDEVQLKQGVEHSSHLPEVLDANVVEGHYKTQVLDAEFK
jgi:hypothetical protein